uniref:USP domain-containing protein n=1 Tax=Globisporangium ultimum (strain ATCC 200006 / CBS 805.95 / DAOM BR144) TaxID=431595 RepID=K3WZ95_GLOUD
MQATALSSDDGPLLSAFGEIVHRGWLNLKTRSMVNVRPRHMRYCILAKDSNVLSTFKFQPSTGDLTSGNVKPLKSYKVLGVAPWDGRRFAFLISVIQPIDNTDRVLEVDAPVAQAASEWIHHLRILVNGADDNWPSSTPNTVAFQGSRSFTSGTSNTSDTSPNTSTSSKRSHDMWVKGASVHRGLLNASGENSCFLNVIIQSFWHLTSMRHFLLHVEIKDGTRTVEANVLRALKTIMMEYDDTSSGVIHSRGLRKGLSVLYAADKNFQEGAMYDAEETLLALLNLMHQQTNATDISETQKTTAMVKSLVRLVSHETYEVEDKSRAVFDEHSIPHLVFSHQIYDRYTCNTCHRTTPWDLYSNLIFTTYASDLYKQKYESMEHMFRQISLQDADVAPSCDVDGCKGKHTKERVIHRFPMVFTVSVLWATNSATKDQVHGLLLNIGDRVDLAKCFDAAGPVIKFKLGGIRTTYRLRGFVCYYGRHYVALFYSTAHKMWLLFDDSRVLEIGSWDNVISECLKGRFQPVLFFYELPDQRKDSSVSLFSMSGGDTSIAAAAAESRKKSLSFSSMQGDLTIPESPDEETADSPLPRKKPLLRVEEEPAPALFGGAPADVVPPAAPTAPIATTSVGAMRMVESDREFELGEMKRRGSISRINIMPVSAAIAMMPRTISMNAPLGDGEYDVQFGDDTVVLGMYLEKVGTDLCVTSFPRGVHDEMFGAEKSGQIGLFDLVLQANGHPLQHYQVDRALKMIKAQSRPLVIRFRRSPRVASLTDMGFSKELACQALAKSSGDVQAAVNLCFEMRQS